MLTGNPLIARTYVRERFSDDGQWHQTLVVETRLPPPKATDPEVHHVWAILYGQLAEITSNGFTGCTAFEVRPEEDDPV
ncbi:MAG: hypothetical protein KKA05_01250 [Alphaproteobacteria bacterium]|nr:hypothetical protein [Alphaproteobacteria bacterium]